MTAESASPSDAPSIGDRWRQAGVLASILATVAMNILANVLPLLGRTTGEISDAYPVPFTPAGYVFSIWGLIYLGLILFGVWQALPDQARDPRLRAAAPWVVLTGAFNVGWLVAWHAELVVLSVLPIVGLLVSLAVVYERLRRGPGGRAMQVFARLPFAIYLGWLTVATVANVAVAGWALDWRGAPFSPEVWALIMIVVASTIGIRMLQVRGDVAFALVLVWAFVGVAVRAGFPGLLASGASVAAALVLGGAVGRLARPASGTGR